MTSVSLEFFTSRGDSREEEAIAMKYFLVVLCFLISACASKKVVTSGPDSMDTKASVQYSFAWEFLQSGDVVRALAAALKGVEEAPKSADMRNILGLIYFRQQDYPKAEEAFKKAIEIDPKLPELYNNLGAMYYEQKRFAEARDVLLKGLDFPLYLNPERIHNNLGLVYEGLNEPEKAEQAYRSAIVANENFFLSYQNLGRMLLEKGQIQQSRVMLGEAVRLCQNCVEARYHFGTSLLRDNKKKEAIEQFRIGAEKDPRGYFGELCRQFLVGENKKPR
jgi:type IV pilus biogenesis/stability protein PilW